MCRDVFSVTWMGEAYCFPISLSLSAVFLSYRIINYFSLSFSLFLQYHCRCRLHHLMEKSASENPSSFYVKVGQEYTETKPSPWSPCQYLELCEKYWKILQINKINCKHFKPLKAFLLCFYFKYYRDHLHSYLSKKLEPDEVDHCFDYNYNTIWSKYKSQ